VSREKHTLTYGKELFLFVVCFVLMTLSELFNLSKNKTLAPPSPATAIDEEVVPEPGFVAQTGIILLL
jgi:hypothetical protein